MRLDSVGFANSSDEIEIERSASTPQTDIIKWTDQVQEILIKEEYFWGLTGSRSNPQNPFYSNIQEAFSSLEHITLLVPKLCFGMKEVGGKIEQASFCHGENRTSYNLWVANIESRFKKLGEAYPGSKVPSIRFRLREKAISDILCYSV